MLEDAPTQLAAVSAASRPAGLAAARSALSAKQFGPGQVRIRPRGNVLACIAFLAGMAREELTARELDSEDPRNPLVVTVRAVKRS